MTQDTPAALPSELALIEKAVRHVGIKSLLNHGAGSLVYSEGVQGVTQEDLVAYTREIALHCAVALGPQAATSAAGGATGEQPLPHVPKGFEIYYLKGFDALFDALNRAVEKGYLPDAMTEEWEAFDCMGPVAALAVQSPAVPRGPINFTKEWCLQAAEAEEAGNACWDAGAAQSPDSGAGLDPNWALKYQTSVDAHHREYTRSDKSWSPHPHVRLAQWAYEQGFAAALAQQGAQNG